MLGIQLANVSTRCSRHPQVGVLICTLDYRKSGNFCCKPIFVADGSYDLQKCMRPFNVNVVRGCSYEKFST